MANGNSNPPLCKTHFFKVASYFDKDVAFEFELDGDTCLICNKVIFLEGARRFVEQHNHEVANGLPSPVAAE